MLFEYYLYFIYKYNSYCLWVLIYRASYYNVEFFIEDLYENANHAITLGVKYLKKKYESVFYYFNTIDQD